MGDCKNRIFVSIGINMTDYCSQSAAVLPLYQKAFKLFTVPMLFITIAICIAFFAQSLGCA